MKFVLKGYFDSNFGDDCMMKIIVRSLPDIDFVVEDTRYTQSLLLERNVSVKDGADTGLPILIVIGCGFMINTFTALKCELKWFLKNTHVGDYCMGWNAEPLNSVLKRFLIKRKFRKFRMIICRDQKSFDWLNRAGLGNTAVYKLPDIVFSLPDEWANRCAEPSALGISLFHRAGDKPDCAYYKAMAAAADFWVEKTGNPVYLMAFDTGREDDTFACRSVKDRMRFSNQAQTVSHRGGSEIIDAYAKCRKIIGGRFHAAVLAMRMNIDVFPLIYRDKTQNLINDIQYPITGCNIDDIDLAKIKAFLLAKESSFRISREVIRLAGLYPQIFREECTGQKAL